MERGGLNGRRVTKTMCLQFLFYRNYRSARLLLKSVHYQQKIKRSGRKLLFRTSCQMKKVVMTIAIPLL